MTFYSLFIVLIGFGCVLVLSRPCRHPVLALQRWVSQFSEFWLTITPSGRDCTQCEVIRLSLYILSISQTLHTTQIHKWLLAMVAKNFECSSPSSSQERRFAGIASKLAQFIDMRFI